MPSPDDERILELTGSQTRSMVRSGPVESLVEGAGFFLTNLAPETTGVEGGVIWIAAGEFDRDEADGGPRIVVVIGKGLSPRGFADGVTVTLSTPPRVIGRLPDATRASALRFVELNRDVLLKYWHGEIDTAAVIERFQRVRYG